MMAAFIGVPLKKSNEVDLVQPLKNVLSSYGISVDEPLKYESALKELNKLRMSSTRKTIDKSESSLEVMSRYYDHLCDIEPKWPSVEFPVAFMWTNAFDRGSLFTGSAAGLTIASLLYERLCILFNIAAMQSQIAVDYGTGTLGDDGFKQAAKYFQLSSGAFWHVKSMIGDLRHDLTPDLQPDTLSALHSLMLAQAQESFFHKAMADNNMKELAIAEVASQCEDHYAEALRHMQKETTRVIWDKEWMAMITGKQAGFQALAEYYKSLACKAKKEVGEEVARLKHAVELIKLAKVRGGATVACFKDFVNKITYEYEKAKQDNDFVLHARVPDIESLQPVGKAPLAKPTPLPERLCHSSTDAVVLSIPRRREFFTEQEISIKAKLIRHTKKLTSVLASLNLPAALEDTTGDSIPQSLKDKGQFVLEKGGCESLTRVIEELPNLLQRNKEILNECTRMLNDEEESDNKMRAQFKTSWSRTPSSKLNEPLKSNIQKYHTVISNATNADEIVRQKFKQNKEKITMLCLPEDELMSRIPKGSPVAVCPSAEELRKLMNQVKELLYERTSLKDELDSRTIDMKSKFLGALAQDGCINESSISVSTLEELYGSVQRSIQDNLEKQDHIVAEIQRANAEFCKEKNQKASDTDRETVLKDLAIAYDVFVELSGNLAGGIRFQKKFESLLIECKKELTDRLDLESESEEEEEFSDSTNTELSSRIEAAIKKCSTMIENFCAKLHVKEKIKNDACRLGRDIFSTEDKMKMKHNQLSAACLYTVARENGDPITLTALSLISGQSKAAIAKCYKKIHVLLGKIPKPVNAMDYLHGFASKLQLSTNVLPVVQKVVQKLIRSDIVSGRSPLTIAAAAIYVTTRDLGFNITHKEVCDVAGISMAGLKVVLKLIEPHVDVISSENFLSK